MTEKCLLNCVYRKHTRTVRTGARTMVWRTPSPPPLQLITRHFTVPFHDLARAGELAHHIKTAGVPSRPSPHVAARFTDDRLIATPKSNS